MAAAPPTQYADDRNLRARQRIWEFQEPPFDLVGWVLGLLDVRDGDRVLDAGCGNGSYIRALSAIGVEVVGCDLSLGMLAGIRSNQRVNADAVCLPFRDGAFLTRGDTGAFVCRP